MIILIADGGSTSTKWAVVDTDRPDSTRRLRTAPINPTLCTDAELIRRELAPIDCRPGCIRFYGSGCTPAAAPFLREVLCRHFGLAAEAVQVSSDLVGAARALWAGGEGRGVACILGTGAIAARVRFAPGEEEIAPAPSLGYILGDEGSGSWLGRHYLSDYLKGQLPASMSADIARRHPELTPAEVIERVYRQPAPNRYLASMVPLLLEYRDTDYVRTLVREGFGQFFRRNVLPAAAGETALLQDVRFVGSIAHVFRAELEAVAGGFGARVTRVLAEPLEQLVVTRN
jgi:N-acetylglucosamine kinase-like BadF-type ATPase